MRKKTGLARVSGCMGLGALSGLLEVAGKALVGSPWEVQVCWGVFFFSFFFERGGGVLVWR